MTAGQNHLPVEKTRENYGARIVYEDTNAKNVGNESGKYITIDGFNAGIVVLLASADMNAAHNGTPVRDSEHETYSATLKCHDPNGELYFVNFSRDQITLNSYEDDAIRTKVETWADTVPALA
jgi:hypothetical protein